VCKGHEVQQAQRCGRPRATALVEARLALVTIHVAADENIATVHVDQLAGSRLAMLVLDKLEGTSAPDQVRMWKVLKSDELINESITASVLFNRVSKTLDASMLARNGAGILVTLWRSETTLKRRRRAPPARALVALPPRPSPGRGPRTRRGVDRRSRYVAP
jgi:hypothetical protein